MQHVYTLPYPNTGRDGSYLNRGTSSTFRVADSDVTVPSQARAPHTAVGARGTVRQCRGHSC
jgi:hypothetical protein